MSIIGGALISAGGSLLSGLLGRRSQKKRDRKSHDFERQRIRMIVNDARLAGIHPLAALGHASGASNPYQVGGGDAFAQGLAESANQVGDAISRRGDKAEQKARLEVLKSEAERNKAEAAAMVAEATSRTQIARATAATRTARAQAKSGIIVAPTNTHIGRDAPPVTTGMIPMSVIEEEHGEIPALLESVMRLPDWARQSIAPVIGRAIAAGKRPHKKSKTHKSIRW